MANFNSLLVVVDPTRSEQGALSRAVELAEKTGAQIKVFLAIYDFSYEMTTMLSGEEREAMRRGVISQREEWLTEVIDGYADRELPIQVKVVWHNRPFEAIIQEVLRDGHDLIVKATHEHDKLKSVIFTPTDWHLMRKSPVPVLLVKQHAWPAKGNILAAVNSGSEEEAHISLNTQIVTAANDMATLLDADVHLVNTYPGTPVNIAIEIPEFDPKSYNEAVCDHHVKELHKQAEHGGIDVCNCHVKEGLPEDIIPRLADDLDAELVILGSIGRTGLSAALIGNTAEHIIDSLNCDVLALKPAGFVSPVELDD
ncbi:MULTISPECIES: universal stress protein UspE [Corallincola]|uniref:Universal stress protein UspE n=3 Tax=Corallincola TaxID=1775176 RepID=A0A368NRA0_9GAMM|nr:MULTISPECIES: universal stress protein UspE [Corallincola]RCU52686.1 universal stress protein UspE [Corallincola holothuriorum]TAA48134.1 universal stress protein UspE [Corallincola spongiicola]TCI03186.1 universal stress protein UspE [Corallincola luteus]